MVNKNFEKWIETHGRRLAELKILGGNDLFDRLDGEECIELFTLLGQLEGFIKALSPENRKEAKRFRADIKKMMDSQEKKCHKVFKATGKLSVPKTSA